jgi:type I restriction enzyme M protein
MADELSKPPYNRKLPIPAAYNWESLTGKRGAELEAHYTTLLSELGQQKGVLGQIFTQRFTRDHCNRQNFFRYYMAER